ncbi:MAG: hypothetical protein HY236_01855 [Acidobacteria bacterium]|nr:hypothetical protein [Acidobacteriota bacterium]
MKFLSAFICIPLWFQTAAWAIDFSTFQAARLVIGQPNFTAETPVSDQDILGAAGGVAVAGNRLFVLDANRFGAAPVNNRLLIYENLSGFISSPDAEIVPGTACPVCVGRPTTVLGQPDFTSKNPGLQNGLNKPTAAASDGVQLAVADTDNNRVLIWRTIPAVSATPPDVVLGQPDFATSSPRTDQSGLRGPQGVWFHNGKLIIADTQNARVLIFNSVPTSNNAKADVVVGEPDFSTRPSPDLTASNIKPAANNMLDPVTATTVGEKLIVTDLGFNRVVIFNSIPTSNSASADLVLGQPDMASQFANNSTKDSKLCASSGTDSKGNPTFPVRCAATLSFPRFALSDGTRLFIADGGNDRVLVYKTFPTANGAPADVVLGQKDFFSIGESNGAGSLRTPSSLAWDGDNLYVADPFSRRILVFTPAEPLILDGGVVNGASYQIPAEGTVTFGGTVKSGDVAKLIINGKEYDYTETATDTLQTIRDNFLHQINDSPGDPVVSARPAVGQGTYARGAVTFGGSIQAGDVVTIQIQDRRYTYTVRQGDTQVAFNFAYLIRDQGKDPDVYADVDPSDHTKLILVARQQGEAGNSISYKASTSSGAKITVTTGGATLTGGSSPPVLILVARTPGSAGNTISLDTTGTAAALNMTTSSSTLSGGNDASEAPPGTQIAIFGHDFVTTSAGADSSQEGLPTELGGVEVYMNGIRSPIYIVTPNQINAQVPFEMQGSSMSVFLRATRPDGQVVISVAKPAAVPRAAPGLYAYDGPEPRAGVVVHGMARARGTVAIEATTTGSTPNPAPAGLKVQIIINGRNYTYTTVGGETTDQIRDRLVTLINAGNGDPDAQAEASNIGILSARARVTINGTIKAGDVVTINIGSRTYIYTVLASDNLPTVANQLINLINAGAGDPNVTARLVADVTPPEFDIIARQLGAVGNSITLTITVSANASITATTNVKNGTLAGGSTPSTVILNARSTGKDGNNVSYSATVSGGSGITATAQTTSLCCGNDFFSPVTPENPALPGEIITVFGTGLGLTDPKEGVVTGRRVPADHGPFKVPAVPDDFVSALAGGKTADVDFVGLMPGQIGVYQVNLLLNSALPDDLMTRLTIAQGFFVSNVVTFPVRNRVPPLQ